MSINDRRLPREPHAQSMQEALDAFESAMRQLSDRLDSDAALCCWTRLWHRLRGARRPSLPRTAWRWPAMDALATRLGLHPFECDLLLICTAFELKPSLGPIYARLQGTSSRPYPTLDLAIRVVRMFRHEEGSQPTWAVLSPQRPLRYWRLVEITPAPAASLAGGPLKLDPRILNYLIGLNGDASNWELHPALQNVMAPLPTAQGELSASQEQAAVRLSDLWATSHLRTPPVVQLLGPNGESKRLVAQQAVAQLAGDSGRPAFLFHTSLDALSAAGDELPGLARMWRREVNLYPFLFLLVEGVGGPSDQGSGRDIDRLLAELRGAAVAVCLQEPRPLDGHDTRLLDVDKPKTCEQKQRWCERGADRAAAGQLVSRFHLNFPAIDRLTGQIDRGCEPAERTARLLAAAREYTRPGLDFLADRIDPKASWDDLILSPAELDLLHRIADQVRCRSVVYDDWGLKEQLSRGLGLSVLFAGESGTGKTFAAEVLACDLELDLYRIDLSAVVDKYIGETEKRLRQLFDAAEDGGSILLFDEADALFGNRLAETTSHDRFANIQINYLLQRIESFQGLAILTTNRKAAIDAGFLRRLRFIVNFPFPGPRERESIWRRILPARPTAAVGVPTHLDDRDYAWLARLDLTGGNIRTVAMNATFLAAAREPAGSPGVTLDLVKEAARMEFRKLDQPLPAELKSLSP